MEAIWWAIWKPAIYTVIWKRYIWRYGSDIYGDMEAIETAIWIRWVVWKRYGGRYGKAHTIASYNL